MFDDVELLINVDTLDSTRSVADLASRPAARVLVVAHVTRSEANQAYLGPSCYL